MIGPLVISREESRRQTIEMLERCAKHYNESISVPDDLPRSVAEVYPWELPMPIEEQGNGAAQVECETEHHQSWYVTREEVPPVTYEDYM